MRFDRVDGKDGSGVGEVGDHRYHGEDGSEVSFRADRGVPFSWIVEGDGPTANAVVEAYCLAGLRRGDVPFEEAVSRLDVTPPIRSTVAVAA